MPITPEEINGGKLPVGVRGYQRDATDDLLKRVAWDFRQMLRSQLSSVEEAQSLKRRNEELEEQIAALQEAVAIHARRGEVADRLEQRETELEHRETELEQRGNELALRTAELEGQVASLQEVLGRYEQRERVEDEMKEHLKSRAEELETQVSSLRASLTEHERRDDLTRTLLASALQAARELRESTRSQCDTILKKARQRAAEIERKAHAHVKASAREVERLRQVQSGLRDELQHTLESMLREVQGEDGKQKPEAELGAELETQLEKVRPRPKRLTSR